MRLSASIDAIIAWHRFTYGLVSLKHKMDLSIHVVPSNMVDTVAAPTSAERDEDENVTSHSTKFLHFRLQAEWTREGGCRAARRQ